MGDTIRKSLKPAKLVQKPISNFAPSNVYEACVELKGLCLKILSRKAQPNEHLLFKKLRGYINNYPTVLSACPDIIKLSHDADDFLRYKSSLSSKSLERKTELAELFKDAISAAEILSRNEIRIDSAGWTGIASDANRIAMMREALPNALSAIDIIIAELSWPGHNGGPISDERLEAIEQLKLAHNAIGNILSILENNDTNPPEGLFGETSRFVKRACECLSSDPLPYAASGLIVTVLSVLGFPDAAGWFGGAALSFSKQKKV